MSEYQQKGPRNVPKPEQTPADYITPLDMNGLQGRVLRLPPPKNRSREILLIYGHHALIERWWGLAQTLNQYGAVTLPDLPGFGGMDSFRKIGKRPTVDAFADYLAAFVKMQYKRRRVTIIGISFGFVVATRMLQKYPELAKRVDFVVSIVGFVHRDDFLFKPWEHAAARYGSMVVAAPPVAFFVRHALLNKFFLKNVYAHWSRAKRRFADTPPEVFAQMLDFEVKLWQANDVHTHWLTTAEFLNIDNCGTRVDLPVWHICSKGDHYFDNNVVEQHMRVVFSDYHQAVADLKAHTPSVVADRKAMAVLVPPALRRALAKTD